MTEIQTISRADMESWLSIPRYERYRDVTEDDDELALELYLWNVGLAQAVLKDVAFFEVALRNAYDRAISESWSGSQHWLFDDTSPVRRPIMRSNRRGSTNDFNRFNRKTIDKLKSKFGRNPSPDKVIANLTLGFWAHMTDRHHDQDLWVPAIHEVWPAGTRRSTLHERITRINSVRNRAAHHEHLFEHDGRTCTTKAACEDAVELFRQLGPNAAHCLYDVRNYTSSVDEYVANNPAPCTVEV